MTFTFASLVLYISGDSPPKTAHNLRLALSSKFHAFFIKCTVPPRSIIHVSNELTEVRYNYKWRPTSSIAIADAHSSLIAAGDAEEAASVLPYDHSILTCDVIDAQDLLQKTNNLKR